MEDSVGCQKGSLEVRDGHHKKGKLLGKFCGSTVPEILHSKRNTMTVKFISNEGYPNASFSAKFLKDVNECKTSTHRCAHLCENTLGSYKCKCRRGYTLSNDTHCRDLDECASKNGHCEQYCINTIGSYYCSCTDEYTLQPDGRKCKLNDDIAKCKVSIPSNISGRIISPNYPDSYRPFQRCSWDVRIPRHHTLFLWFNHFDLEESRSCDNDKVTIISILNGEKFHTVGKYCGSTIPNIITLSKYLRLKFDTNGFVEKSGFSAEFRIDLDECANENGKCEQNCNNTIGSYYCSCRDGYTLQSDGHKCKKKNAVKCGAKLRDKYGKIESPFYPKTYRPNTNCFWVVIVPRQHSIFLWFNHFNLEESSGCKNDMVIIQSVSQTKKLRDIQRSCGSTIPDPITLSEHDIRVTFRSNGRIQKSGFSAEFQIDLDECQRENDCQHHCHNSIGSYYCSCAEGYALEPDGHNCGNVDCGGTFKGSQGKIESPSFPDSYRPNDSCFWNIIAPPKHIVILTFKHFDLEESDNCENDHLIVESISSSNERHEHGKFCGSTIPDSITSSREVLKIKFKSNGFVQRTGFSAEFQIDHDECASARTYCRQYCHNTIGSYYCSCAEGYTLEPDGYICRKLDPNDCGGIFHDLHGKIESPSFPGRYLPFRKCVWDILVPSKHRVSLRFKHFDLEYSENCENDSVIVKSISTHNKAKDIRKFCGSRIPDRITSTERYLRIEFESNGFVEKSGFSAEFKTVPV